MIKNDVNKYDLEQRTITFAENVIVFLKKTSITSINRNIVEQLVAAATSIGANYFEATEAESRKDFIHKIALCKKESKETLYWFRMIAKCNPEKREEVRLLYIECKELLLIFSKSISKAKQSLLN